eukprot:scaffold2114_cov253-Pinguiococcus_pyrenoidosus.AAC.3
MQAAVTVHPVLLVMDRQPQRVAKQSAQPLRAIPDVHDAEVLVVAVDGIHHRRGVLQLLPHARRGPSEAAIVQTQKRRIVAFSHGLHEQDLVHQGSMRSLGRVEARANSEQLVLGDARRRQARLNAVDRKVANVQEALHGEIAVLPGGRRGRAERAQRSFKLLELALRFRADHPQPSLYRADALKVYHWVSRLPGPLEVQKMRRRRRSILPARSDLPVALAQHRLVHEPFAELAILWGIPRMGRNQQVHEEDAQVRRAVRIHIKLVQTRPNGGAILHPGLLLLPILAHLRIDAEQLHIAVNPTRHVPACRDVAQQEVVQPTVHLQGVLLRLEVPLPPGGKRHDHAVHQLAHDLHGVYFDFLHAGVCKESEALLVGRRRALEDASERNVEDVSPNWYGIRVFTDVRQVDVRLQAERKHGVDAIPKEALRSLAVLLVDDNRQELQRQRLNRFARLLLFRLLLLDELGQAVSRKRELALDDLRTHPFGFNAVFGGSFLQHLAKALLGTPQVGREAQGLRKDEHAGEPPPPPGRLQRTLHGEDHTEDVLRVGALRQVAPRVAIILSKLLESSEEAAPLLRRIHGLFIPQRVGAALEGVREQVSRRDIVGNAAHRILDGQTGQSVQPSLGGAVSHGGRLVSISRLDLDGRCLQEGSVRRQASIRVALVRKPSVALATVAVDLRGQGTLQSLPVDCFKMKQMALDDVHPMHLLDHRTDLQNVRSDELETSAPVGCNLQPMRRLAGDADSAHVQKAHDDQLDMRPRDNVPAMSVLKSVQRLPSAGRAASVRRCPWRHAELEQVVAALLRRERRAAEVVQDAVAKILPERLAVLNGNRARHVIQEPCHERVDAISAGALVLPHPAALEILQRILQLAAHHLDEHQVAQVVHGLSRYVVPVALVIHLAEAVGPQQAHVPDVDSM